MSKKKKHSIDITNSKNAPEWFKKDKKKYPGIEYRIIVDEEAAEDEFWEEIRSGDAVELSKPDENKSKDGDDVKLDSGSDEFDSNIF